MNDLQMCTNKQIRVSSGKRQTGPFYLTLQVEEDSGLYKAAVETLPASPR